MGEAQGPSKKSDYLKAAELEDDKLDLAGILNVLDGVVDSPQRIVIMTTNHPEKLDPALIRPGRINKIINLGYMGWEDMKQMIEHFNEPLTGEQTIKLKEVGSILTKIT